MEGVYFRSHIAGILCILSPLAALAGPGANSNNSPVQFMQNKGQITDQFGVVRKDIDAKVEANGVVMFVGDGEMHYQWQRQIPNGLSSASVPPPSAKLTPPPAGDNAISEMEIYRMDVKLVGANKNAQVIFEEPTGYYENYYLAHTGENGVRANGYGRVIYKDIYPNIDLVFYTAGEIAPKSPYRGLGDATGQISDDLGNEFSPPKAEDRGVGSRGIKYDFIIHPGGNPADIQLRYEGATELKLADGPAPAGGSGRSLVATTPYGSITEETPYSYIAGAGEVVASAYKLSGNTLSFDMGSYTGTLVIDPVLKWGTYYGGTGDEFATYSYRGGVTSDQAGNAYILMSTKSTANIATTGAHQTSLAGNADWMIAKFNISGVRQWCTYYGGLKTDAPSGITTDNNNNVYCIGETENIGLATSGAYQAAYKASPSLPSDSLTAILVKFNTSGARQWATYYGDTCLAKGRTVSCDANGNVWIGGGVYGYGSSLLATNGAYQTNPAQGYYAQFSSSGSRLYASYYPGSAFSIVFDGNGNYYLAGGTSSTTGIASIGAHQTGLTGGIGGRDGFIAKFSSNHTRLWGTYYGGNSIWGYGGTETIYDAVCDASGNLYVVGSTQSTSGIATNGAFQATLTGTGSADGFLAKFNPTGARQWGTYYGTSSNEYMHSIDIGNDGLLYTAGFTNGFTSNALATPGAYLTSWAAGYMAIWGQDGSRQYATYYGGASGEYISGISCTQNGKVYFTGVTASTTGIATVGSQQSSYAGGALDAFLVQWDMDTLVYVRQPFTDTFVCTGDTLHVSYGVNQKFRSNNSFTVQLSNSSGSFASPTTLATKNSDTADTIACYLPLSIPSGSGYRIRVIATAPADTSEDNARNIRISSYPANFTAGSNSPLCSGDTLELNSGTTTTGVTYSWAGPGSFTSADDDTIIANTTVANTGDYYITVNNNGCMVKDTVSVVVNQKPQNVTAGNNGGLCTGDTLLLSSSSTTSGVSYAWTGPNNYNTQNVTRPNVQMSDAGTYTVTVTLGSCSDTAVTTVVVNQGASVNIAPLTPVSICAGDTAQFAAFPNNAGTNPQLQWLKNGVAVSGATGTLYKTSTLANGDIISVLLTPNTSCPGAKESNTITMTVQPILTPTVTMTADNMPPWNGGLTVTFTATPTHGGTAPEYQWKRNGQDITGATGATWGVIVNALNANEDICVVLKSSYECAVPDTAMSNCITTAFTGVGDIVNNKNIKIYPNPVSGNVTISSTERIEKVEILNLLGQKLLTGYNNSTTMQIDMSGFVGGVYIIKVNDGYISRVVKE